VEESWLLAALTLPADGLSELLSKAHEMLASPVRSDIGAAKALASLSILASSLDTSVLEGEIAATYLRELAKMHAVHPNEPGLREQWANGVTNFVYHRAAQDPASCQALLAALDELRRAHPDEPGLREVWASGVTNFVYHRAAQDPAGCQALLEAAARLAKSHESEVGLLELLVAAALFWIRYTWGS
jgi:hypothetical protein